MVSKENKNKGNEGKFIWKEGDIEKAVLSQCVKCKNNINYITCNEFNVKPLNYVDNKAVCPKKK